MGGLCHARNLQHHAASGAHLRQRRTLPDSVLPVRRGVRNQLRRPQGQIPGAEGDCAAEVVGSARGSLFRISCGGKRRRLSCCDRFRTLALPRLMAFAFFVYVLDRRLVDHQIRLAAVSYNLETVLVVPLDDAVNLLAVAEHDDQWCLRLHLFLIIEILGVGLLRGREFLTAEALPLSARALGTLVLGALLSWAVLQGSILQG